MRKFIFLLTALFLFSFIGIAQADIRVLLDHEPINFDVQPVIENDRTLVPLRTIFEALGAKVEWDDSTNTVTAKKEATEIKLVIGGEAYKNGQLVNLDVPARIIDNRTMVPLRFVSEALGAKVKYQESISTVLIFDKAMTELTWAAYDGDIDKVKELLNAGADINELDNSDQTPLMAAMLGDQDDIVNLLLNSGADPNKQTTKIADTALNTSYSSKYIKILLNFGANPNTKDSLGYTPLMHQALFNKIDNVKNLLDAGADPNIKNKYGETALAIAEEKGYSDIAKLLESVGALNGLVSYQSIKGGIKINYPSYWSKETNDVQIGMIVAFYAPQENKTDAFKENITIAIQDLSKQPMTLQEYTQLSLNQFNLLFSNPIIVEKGEFTLANNPGYKIIFTPNEKLKIMSVYTIKNNKAYLLTYIAETDKYENYLKTVLEVLNSFEILDSKINI